MSLVCVNGHAMDDGLLECPCCGAYRPSGCLPREGMTHTEQMAAIAAALHRSPRAMTRDSARDGLAR